MLEADLPLRLTAVIASGIVGLAYLTPLQIAIYLGSYLPCDLHLVYALRRLSEKPESGFRLRHVQVSAFLNMAVYLVPAVLLWQLPGTTPKLGATLMVFGGMLSVMLVRAAFLPMTIANALPLAGFVLVIAALENDLMLWHEQLFLFASVVLLAAYFLLTLRAALQINRRLVESKDAALGRIATQRRFLATMSHELRTPLNGILGMSQQLTTSHPGLGAEVIRDSAREMSALVGDLLDNAAIEAGAVRIEKQIVWLPSLLKRIEDRWAAPFAAKGLALTIAVDPAVPERLNLDPLRVTQCLSNLLANALRHTRSGGAMLGIRYQEPMLVVTVTDTGLGIPAHLESQLFQPFMAITSDPDDAGPSTGLGLSICHGLAKAMGGSLAFERPSAGGSRFVLRVESTVLPHSPIEPQPNGGLPHAEDTVKLGGPISLKNKQALVVDDIATNRLVLRLALQSLGMKVDDAGSGDKAVEKIRARQGKPFDLVLMDLRMPGLSGVDALGVIRQQGYRGPIIAVSADAAPEERTEALAHGFDGYLTKPVELDRLSALLVDVVTRPLRGL